MPLQTLVFSYGLKCPYCFSPFNSLTCGPHTSVSSSTSGLRPTRLTSALPRRCRRPAPLRPHPPPQRAPPAAGGLLPLGRAPPPPGFARAGRRRALGRACRRRARRLVARAPLPWLPSAGAPPPSPGSPPPARLLPSIPRRPHPRIPRRLTTPHPAPDGRAPWAGEQAERARPSPASAVGGACGSLHGGARGGARGGPSGGARGGGQARGGPGTPLPCSGWPCSNAEVH